MSVNEISDRLAAPQSTIATNVQMLEDTRLITTEFARGTRGQQKMCASCFDEIVIRLDGSPVEPRDDVIFQIGKVGACSQPPKWRVWIRRMPRGRICRGPKRLVTLESVPQPLTGYQFRAAASAAALCSRNVISTATSGARSHWSHSRQDTELAERLARQHTLDLAAHVERNVHYQD